MIETSEFYLRDDEKKASAIERGIKEREKLLMDQK